MINGDRIRSMSNDELLSLLRRFEKNACTYCFYGDKNCSTSCGEGYKKWLESEDKQSEK